MKLNIVTAASNSVGKSILEKVANPVDITIGLSRKGCAIAHVLDGRITDLTHTETTKKELLHILSTVDIDTIASVHLYHNCGYVVAELPGLTKENKIFQHSPDLLPKMFVQDEDGDGIDDRTYHSAITTFLNVFNVVNTVFQKRDLSVGIICSLTDKKDYVVSAFQSMIKTNRKLRALVENITREHTTISGVCVSASTVRTQTEEKFRQYSPDKNYWATTDYIAGIFVESMQSSYHTYIDVDAYVPHPEYEMRFRNETDQQFTDRLKRECLGPFNY